ncbi:LysM peptidoglycan-binding domain-containing protein [Henriciella sp.]|uniref:LysM peptidoglycan-binding domain-containing protein n=1 Tax=Henriciella sp. TaxID=1968823 RepID=UPI00263832EB|nr:LysM domain-containing protein [Henriciella sp.]
MIRPTTIMMIVGTVLTTACSHTPPEAPDPVETVSQPEVVPYDPAPEIKKEAPLTTRERTQRAIQLLDKGEEALALIEIEAMLAINPDNATAVKLLDQIRTDPVELLGESHKLHNVQPGETTSSLAQDFLGDALFFYALSRYNDLEAPNRLMAGQSLRIPTRFGDMAGDREEQELVTAPSSQPEPVQAVSATDVAAANALRLQALEQLNTGNTDRAVSLLRRARGLDSNNPNIAADLEKAERIQKALNKTG